MKNLSFILFFLLFISFSSTVQAQEITVFPGFWSSEYYQDDERITKAELNALMAKNDAINAYWKKAKTQEIIGSISLAAEFGLAFWAFGELYNDNSQFSEKDKAKNALGPMIGALGAATVGVIFLHAAGKSKKKAILTYNKQFDTKTSFRLVPVSNQNGLGWAIRF